jgi:hypothetical protein
MSHSSTKTSHSYSINYLPAFEMKTFSILVLSTLLSGISGLVIPEEEVNYTLEGLELLNTTSTLDKRANYDVRE